MRKSDIVAIVNVYGHTYHSEACSVLVRAGERARYIPKFNAEVYFGMIECEKCRARRLAK